MEEKKLQSKQMIKSAYSLINNYYQLANTGIYSEQEAKNISIESIRSLRYGDINKDYFWILDHNGNIISHPYYSNTDIKNDSLRKNFEILKNIVAIALKNGDGYYQYKWQWNDDPNRVESKISYFENFEPWKWVIGTGFYITDVEQKINIILKYIITVMFSIIVLIVIFHIIILRKAFKNVSQIIITENEILHSEEKFSYLTKNVDSGLIILENNKIIFLNKKIKEILGIKQPTLTLNSIYEFLAPEERKRFNAILKESRNSKIPVDEIDFWIITRDNQRRYLSNRFSYIERNNKKYTYILTTDITLKKQIELKLKILSDTIDQSPDSTIITDLEGKIIYVNKKFEEITGFTFEEIKDKTPRILKSEKMPPSLYNDLWKTISSGQVWKNELLNKKKNGELFWEHTIIFPIRNEQDEIINYAAIKTDLTKQKQYEDELIQYREEARRAKDIKVAFLKNVSHEVNTPLNAIYGFSYLLREKYINSELDFEYLSTILNNTEILIKLFHDIIDFSSIESGDITIHKKEIEISRLLNKISSKYNVKIVGEFNKPLTVVVDRNPDFENAVLITDKKWFTAIIEELLSNAIKFTEQGTIHIGFNIDYQHITFYIKDSGIGIPETDQKHVFDSFTHGQHVFVSLHRGTGLGLNIARKLTEHLGGSLWFESEVNVGSTFYFNLPSIDVNRYTINKIEISKSPVSDILDNKRILIAEDNEEHFKYMQSLIKNALEISWAKTGYEALSILEKNSRKFEIVFLDILMPQLNGINTAKAIRSTFVDIIIIGVINSDFTLSKEDNKLFDTVLIKPFAKNTLYESVKQALDNRM